MNSKYLAIWTITLIFLVLINLFVIFGTTPKPPTHEREIYGSQDYSYGISYYTKFIGNITTKINITIVNHGPDLEYGILVTGSGLSTIDNTLTLNQSINYSFNQYQVDTDISLHVSTVDHSKSLDFQIIVTYDSNQAVRLTTLERSALFLAIWVILLTTAPYLPQRAGFRRIYLNSRDKFTALMNTISTLIIILFYARI